MIDCNRNTVLKYYAWTIRCVLYAKSKIRPRDWSGRVHWYFYVETTFCSLLNLFQLRNARDIKIELSERRISFTGVSANATRTTTMTTCIFTKRRNIFLGNPDSQSIERWVPLEIHAIVAYLKYLPTCCALAIKEKYVKFIFLVATTVALLRSVCPLVYILRRSPYLYIDFAGWIRPRKTNSRRPGKSEIA